MPNSFESKIFLGKWHQEVTTARSTKFIQENEHSRGIASNKRTSGMLVFWQEKR